MTEAQMIDEMQDTLDAMPHSTVQWLANYHFHRQKHLAFAECVTAAKKAIRKHHENT